MWKAQLWGPKSELVLDLHFRLKFIVLILNYGVNTFKCDHANSLADRDLIHIDEIQWDGKMDWQRQSEQEK